MEYHQVFQAWNFITEQTRYTFNYTRHALKLPESCFSRDAAQ